MKKLLIIYPHWPPSNLAGIHRPRLISNFIGEFGWHTTVLTVNPEFYEEKPDQDILKTVSPAVQVRYVNAFKALKRFRFFGDIGLRSFFQLYKGARKLITSDRPDFVWIPIPSFYTAVIGRLLNSRTGIPYGIDYIDPWVNGFTNLEKKFSRAWLSNAVARILEPFAVKNASLISGVSVLYFQPVLDRNFKNKKIEHLGMPYGFDPNDHLIRLTNIKLPWDPVRDIKPLAYAGAFLPKSHLFIELLFKGIAELKRSESWDKRVQLFFIGTGIYPGKTIGEYARENGIEEIVHEKPDRLPFLEVLHLLSESAGVMIIGSTEKHYTASKVFQSLLSKKPVFAVLHSESSAVQILRDANAADYLCTYTEGISPDDLQANLIRTFQSLVMEKSKWAPQLDELDRYSARQSARLLAEKLDLICSTK